MLRYLAEHSLDHPGIALKEYQIATEVLGRPVGFDPQSDSTVRVQAGRLRVKLAEYYANEGVDDAIIVEIPKGSYALTFHLRPTKAGAQPATLVLESEARKQDVASFHSRMGNRRRCALSSAGGDYFNDRHFAVAADTHRQPASRFLPLIRLSGIVF